MVKLTRLILVLFLAAGVAMSPLFAAEDDAVAVTDADNTPQKEAGEDEAASNEPEEEEEDAPETAASTPPSNEDFIPSTQISEDLSVSFPVDI